MASSTSPPWFVEGWDKLISEFLFQISQGKVWQEAWSIASNKCPTYVNIRLQCVHCERITYQHHVPNSGWRCKECSLFQTATDSEKVQNEADGILLKSALKKSESREKDQKCGPILRGPCESAYLKREQGDHKEAYRLFWEARENNAEALAWVAYYLLEGEGSVPVNLLEAFQLSQLAQNHPLALRNLGFCYMRGLMVKQDLKEALRLYKKAAEGGQFMAQHELGSWYQQNGKGKKAIEYFFQAERQGYARAQFDLALCYLNGIDIKQDYKEAFRLFQLASKQGHIRAETYLGDCYQWGWGIKENLEEAVACYLRSYLRDDSYATYRLAKCYRNGMVVKKNGVEAIRLFQLAAEKGHDEAQYESGDCYEKGIGVSVDLNQAKKFYRLSAQQRNEKAGKRLAELEQVTETQSKSKEGKIDKVTDELEDLVEKIKKVTMNSVVAAPSAHSESPWPFISAAPSSCFSSSFSSSTPLHLLLPFLLPQFLQALSLFGLSLLPLGRRPQLLAFQPLCQLLLSLIVILAMRREKNLECKCIKQLHGPMIYLILPTFHKESKYLANGDENKEIQGQSKKRKYRTGKCNLCGKGFTRMATLNMHMKQHTGDSQERSVCDFPGCTKTYKHKKGLVAHKKKHNSGIA